MTFAATALVLEEDDRRQPVEADEAQQSLDP
jgi:hypothetical protein